MGELQMAHHTLHIGLLAGVVVIPSLAIAADPSLTETLAWMDSTYNPHDTEGGSFGHGRYETYEEGKLWGRQSETLKYNGCDITLTIAEDPTAPLYASMATTIVHTFNLRDIDPRSIAVAKFSSQYDGLPCQAVLDGTTCDLAVLSFETRNQLPAVAYEVHSIFPRLKVKDHESSGTGKSFQASVLLDDVRYAERFEMAFRHAVALCGGQASTF
jgi:hypothetical protein